MSVSSSVLVTTAFSMSDPVIGFPPKNIHTQTKWYEKRNRPFAHNFNFNCRGFCSPPAVGSARRTVVPRRVSENRTVNARAAQATSNSIEASAATAAAGVLEIGLNVSSLWHTACCCVTMLKDARSHSWQRHVHTTD